jgi:hypothetical protein
VSAAFMRLSVSVLSAASPAEVTGWLDALLGVASSAAALCSLSDSYLRDMNVCGVASCDKTVKFLAGSMLAAHGTALYTHLRCVAQYVDWYWRHHSLPGYAHAVKFLSAVGYKATHVSHNRSTAGLLTPTFDMHDSSTVIFYRCSCKRQYPVCDSIYYLSCLDPESISQSEAKVSATMMLGWRA